MGNDICLLTEGDSIHLLSHFLLSDIFNQEQHNDVKHY